MAPTSISNALRPASLLLAASTLIACVATPLEGAQEEESASPDAEMTASMPTLPWAGGTGALAPWGGGDSARWRPEAILANAASRALNEAWARPSVKDAVAAVPLQMIASEYHPYGDGQANAAPSFEGWHEARPPVVATLIQRNDGSQIIAFRFDRALVVESFAFDVHVPGNGAGGDMAVTLQATRDATGDLVADWTPPPSLGLSSVLSTQAMLVHPRGWADWFPLWFRFPVRPTRDLLLTVPSSLATFADGGSIVDHENVTSQKGDTSKTPFQRLFGHVFSAGYNQSPYNPQSIHAELPIGNHTVTTGVGQGWTWVASSPEAPFKVLYTCFERRQPDREASAPDGGVASGGGWHRIGDPAETILNDLEAGPLAVGSVMANPVLSALPSGGFSYGLRDVATFRWLRPGEGFVTARGGSAIDAHGTKVDRAEYHWFLFHQAANVCTEEWVHPYAPTASLDFAPPPSAKSAVTFSVQNAITSLGTSVYLVGDAPALGAWDPGHAVVMSAASYPTWRATALLSQGQTVHYKFVKIDGSGAVTWEGGPDQSFTVPTAAAAQVSTTW